MLLTLVIALAHAQAAVPEADRAVILRAAKEQQLEQNPEVKAQIESILVQSFIDQKLAGKRTKLSPSERQLQEFYAKNPEIRTSHVFVAAGPDAEAKIKKIQALLDQTDASGKRPSFASVAQTYSEGLGAAVGGDLDYRFRDQLDPQYYDAALALKTPGKVSGVVRSSLGFHLIQLTAIKAWSQADHAVIRRMYMRDQENKMISDLAQSIRNQGGG